MLQIREKDLDTRPLIDLIQHLIPLIKRYQGKVFVNDRIDLAMALLGCSDLSQINDRVLVRQ